jgi:hypothetical protein
MAAIFNSVLADRQSMLDRLDAEAAAFLGGTLKERITVVNPNGGIRTEVRDILVELPAGADEAIATVPDSGAPQR